MDHGQYILGPEISELESQLAKYVGCQHAIGVSSGTDALLLALMCYDIGPGDAIITTPFTFISTVEVICLLGATPVFVDIDPNTYNIDPHAIEKTVKACHQRAINLRGILAVDLFGLPSEYDKINDIAQRHNLFVIEDAAQSFGATYYDKRACSLADIGCTSFFPAKPLGGYGDAGMCFTNDDTHAKKIRSLMVHGQGGHRYEHIHIGINGRLDTIQAAILLEKFTLFPDECDARQQVAEKYTRELEKHFAITTPYTPDHCQSVWAQYSIQLESSEQRQQLQAYLKDHDIPSAIYYPIPIHQQPAFKEILYQNQSFPVAETVSNIIMSLPMHPYLSEDQQNGIIQAVLKGLGYNRL
ncbi:MAG: Pleiotropic regulatory protein [Candidatus Magnetoglobus multicellularis str. Araruama]|uniref:Pleiotropic regulatory protein n=1 Tax=Candidatus Magnetoglobus multicellularis str. Araruama TaxID=890399 RepID=A0A1V1PES9_9BACT|nr:MAG: Pleiotropic regulatory protein [Candidatus Magnetoglobus multicellularis str. Araruama]